MEVVIPLTGTTLKDPPLAGFLCQYERDRVDLALLRSQISDSECDCHR